MAHQPARTLAAASLGVAAALLGTPACAHAEPPQPQQVVAPRADAPCADNLVGAMAVLPDTTTNVSCVGAEPKWTVSTTPYPMSDRWLTYGPELRLHGQGMRNPEIMSGRWSGYPQEADAVCSAEQVAVLGPGRVSPPETLTGEPGKPLEFNVASTLFNIKLNGPCLWQRL
jgi:hypothetical protein